MRVLVYFLLIIYLSLRSAQGSVKTKTSTNSRYQSRFESHQGGRHETNKGRSEITARRCDRPLPPESGLIRCGMDNDIYVCTGECEEGYKFPDGSSTLKLMCNKNNGLWEPYISFLPCQRARGGNLRTQTSYKGYSSSHTGSSDRYSDLSSGFSQQQSLCKPLHQPGNGRKECRMSNGDWTCHITCFSGFQFPDGSTEITVTCNDRVGHWSPKDTFDDCKSLSGGGHGYNAYQQTRTGSGSHSWISQQIENEYGENEQYNKGYFGGFGEDKCPPIQSPVNAAKQCKMSNGDWSCQIKCMDGYQFPDGNKELTINCNSRVGQWLPTSSFEDCIAISGGSNVNSFHQQQTFGGFSGEAYNFNQDKCPPIQSPMNAGKQCKMSNGDWSCHIKCMDGYQFSDGNKEVTVNCNSRIGQWLPTSTFEDCKAISGGNQVNSFHQQQTFGGISGGAYNFNEDLCPPIKSPMNGAKQCTMSNGNWKCHITCRSGYKFPEGNTEMTVSCNSRIGQWIPTNNYPDCISISGGGYLEGYHQQQESNGGSYGIYGQQVVGGEQGQSHSNYGQQNQINKLCQDPLAPKNGFIHCSGFNGQRTCQVTCNPGYEFSDRNRQLNIKCYENIGRWTPIENLSDCQILCHPPCENGATCLTHNQCSCTEHVRGNRCQYAISLCDFNKLSSGSVTADCKHNPEYTECQVACPPGSTFDPPSSSVYRCTVNGLWNPPTPPRCAIEREELCKSPPPPENGRIRCVSNTEIMQCTGTCRSGYTFDNGFLELSIQCVKRNGEWTPDIGFPNCQPICSPECRNGGKCLGHNSCLCPSGFRGNRCEYALSLCDAHSRLASVVWECQNTQEETVCNVKCNSGQKLQPGYTTIYKCRLDGKWEPDLKPTCVLAVSGQVIDPRSVQYNRSSKSSRVSTFSQQNHQQFDYYDEQQDIGDLQQTYHELKFRPYGEMSQEQEFSQNSIDMDYSFGHNTNQQGKWQETHIPEQKIQSQYITVQQRPSSREHQGLEQFDIGQHETDFSENSAHGQKTNRNIYQVTDEDPQQKIDTVVRKIFNYSHSKTK